MILYDGHKVYMDGKYPAIFLNGKNTHVHRLEWIKHNGEIPNGYVIHHKNENKLDWDISNLELHSRSTHIREHADIVHRKGIKVVANKDGLTITFNSIEECAIFCGTYTSCIQNVFKGKQKQSNGWTFKRVGD